MTYPFIDRTSSYLETYGYYDSSGALMSAITAINRAVSIVSGVTLAASSVNNMIYGSSTRKLEFTAVSIYNALVLTSVTSLGLASLDKVWATVAQQSGLMTTDIWVNAFATQGTAITFKAVYSTGANILLAGALKVNLFGVGTP